MNQKKATLYRICIAGPLDPDWSDWLDGFEVKLEATQDGPCLTLLTGFVADQAALRGLLSKIWDLNLELVSLQRMPVSPDLKDHRSSPGFPGALGGENEF